LDIFSVSLATIQSNSLSIPINCAEENKTVEILGLIDSGAGGKFIDQNYARNTGFKIHSLDEPVIARNVDGTENKKGRITSFVLLDLTINGKTMTTQLLVTGLGKQKIILGFPWLHEHNPDINWKTGEFKWRLPIRPIKIKRYHQKRHDHPVME
jgi:hypothetical protein